MLMTDLDTAAPALAAALAKRGYETLTPVQSSVLNDAPDGADLLVSAQTGSGKTVAFGLALAPTLLDDDQALPPADAPLALAIAPTRELALQVKAELTWLYAETGAQTSSCVGGMDPRTERRALERGVHIVVGTPGRLRDHIERGALDLSQIRAVVLDEADEMLDLGFREDLEFILDAAPEDRRTLMFSATVPRPIADLAKRFQKDAVRLSTISAKEQHGDIDYLAHPVAPNERENAIINVLRFHEAEKAILFCATREAVKRLTSRLANRGFSIVSLSGELSQAERSNALQAMRDGRARVCVATDVAARGIDLPNLDLVIHADLPTGKAALLHRSGRTGRAGRKGTSVLMVPYPRRRSAERVMQFAGVKAEWVGAPTAAAIRAKDKERLLADPSLEAVLEDEDMATARELLEAHGAEKIAAAFVKLHQSGMPAPEEIAEATDDNIRGRGPGERGGRSAEISGKFEDGIWFRLSLGHKHRADPRWLLPMICRAGHVTKREVGAIKIFQSETRFEIDGKHGERYAETVRRDGTGERGVTITLMDARGGKVPPPPADDRPPRGGRGGPRRGAGRDHGHEGGREGFGGPRRGNRDDRPPRDYDSPRKPRKRRFQDDEPAPSHPAFEPLDERSLKVRSDDGRPYDGRGNEDRPNRDKPRRDGDEHPAARRKAKKDGPKKPKKKAAKKKGPSKAERKAARAKQQG